MSFFSIFPYYLSWHYKEALVGIYNIWRNLLWFILNFFSIKTLFKTFFAPFLRLKENYKGGLDLGNFFETLVVTTLMRLVGMILRTMVIVAGIFVWIFFIFLGAVFFALWFVLPFLLIVVLFFSLKSALNFENL